MGAGDGLSYPRFGSGRTAPSVARRLLPPLAPYVARSSRQTASFTLKCSVAALALLATLAAACGDGSPSGSDGGPPGPPTSGGTPVITSDTLSLDALTARALDAAPGRDSGGYAPPDAADRNAFLDAVQRAVPGSVDAADSVLDSYRYDAAVAVETETGDSLLVVAERVPVARGWGTYVRRLSPDTPADVHVDHPHFDLDSERVGLRLYRECRCRWLLVAGTHRYANPGGISDMARSQSSVFQGLWERVAGSASVAVSVHGFGADNHGEPIRSADVVLSNGGTGTGEGLATTDPARVLRDSMRARGWAVGLAGADEGYEDLAGTVNPQGQYANRTYGHGRWLHLELARPLRADAESRRRVAEAVGAWMRRQEQGEGHGG